MSSKTLKPKTRSNPIVKKEVKNKVGPGKGIDLELTREPRVGDYLRVFLATDKGFKTEVVVHHPIGVTDLDKEDWVSSSPEDIPFLLARAKDPREGEIAAARSNWLLEKAVAAGLMKVSADGDYVYNLNGHETTRKALFDALRDEAKPKQKEKKEFSISDALSRSEDPRSTVEVKIRKLFADLGPEAVKAHSTTFRTLGGARADRPQVALKWAQKRSLQEIADAMLMHGINGPPITTGVSGDVGDAASVNAQLNAAAEARTGGNPTQWCFLPREWEKPKRDAVRKALKVIKDNCEGDEEEKYIFSVSPAKSG